MSRFLSLLILALWFVAGFALAQEPPRTATPVKRTVYQIQFGSASELATVVGQHYQGEPGFRAVAVSASNTILLSAPPELFDDAMRTLSQLDRKPQSFAVEVLFADAAAQPGGTSNLDAKALSGTADEVATRLEELKKQGRLSGLRRVRLAATEGQRATVNATEEVSISMSTQGFAGGRGGPVSTNVTRRNLGTLVEVLPRVSPDGLVQLELRVEDSRPGPSDGGVAEGGGALPVLTMASVKGTVSVRMGQAVVATASSDGEKSRRQTSVIVAVRLAEPGDASRK